MESFPDFTSFPQENNIIRVHMAGYSLIGHIINSSCFENLPRLQYIKMAKMSITEFSWFWSPQRHIEMHSSALQWYFYNQNLTACWLILLNKLHFKSNNLESFPNVLGVLMNLQYLDLQQNPLTCTESNDWINTPGSLQVSNCYNPLGILDQYAFFFS